MAEGPACSRCGASLREGVQFCTICGVEVDMPAAQSPSTTPLEPVTREARPPSVGRLPLPTTIQFSHERAPDPTAPAPALPTHEATPSGRRPTILGLGALLLVLAGLITGLIIRGPGGDTSESAITPTTTGSGTTSPTSEPPGNTTTAPVAAVGPQEPTGTDVMAGYVIVEARDFYLAYPDQWRIDKLDDIPAGTAILDTTIKRDLANPHYVLRVDVARDTQADLVLESAVAGIRGKPSYQEISRRTADFTTKSGTYSATYLEFILNHPDDGVPMRTLDVFFDDGYGRTFAVLTRAPVSDFSNWTSTFDQVRSSLRVRGP